MAGRTSPVRIAASLPAQLDAILRGRSLPRPAWLVLVLAILGCGGLYGMAMGTYAGLTGDRLWQVVASAVKVPFLLLATAALSLPTFFVLNTLLGVRDDFGAALRALLGAQATLTIVLLSLSPVTLFFYASVRSYQAAILFNALMFGLASVGAQVRLRRAYAPLIARHPVHRTLLRSWLFLFALVGIQMGWLLRPFIGDPSGPFQWFRSNAWGNAYLIVARMVLEQFGMAGLETY
jgi:hypothetical protein